VLYLHELACFDIAPQQNGDLSVSAFGARDEV
jgi:hypothetical protein